MNLLKYESVKTCRTKRFIYMKFKLTKHKDGTKFFGLTSKTNKFMVSSSLKNTFSEITCINHVGFALMKIKFSNLVNNGRVRDLLLGLASILNHHLIVVHEKIITI